VALPGFSALIVCSEKYDGSNRYRDEHFGIKHLVYRMLLLCLVHIEVRWLWHFFSSPFAYLLVVLAFLVLTISCFHESITSNVWFL
jgi:hypothetical protein